MYSKLRQWYEDQDVIHTDLDITLKSTESRSSKTFLCHKMVVASHSPVLQSIIIETNMNNTGRRHWIVMWNEDFENFKMLLDYMYNLPVLQKNFVPLFQTALKYEVSSYLLHSQSS